MQQRLSAFCSVLCCLLLCIACSKKEDEPSISNSMSYPGAVAAFDSTHVLILNTSANGDYKDGSIQRYTVDSQGNLSLQDVVSVAAHGTDMAVSPDSKLVALSFDNSRIPAQLEFYDYTSASKPSKLGTLSLSFYEPGSKQSIKRLGFFTPSGGGNYYYLYGVIYSYPRDDGSYGSIPARTFVARVAKDFSSSQVLFTLSYGIGDGNSLAQKSDSTVPYSYGFGSTSPAFDSAHNLFVAFPTGSVGGYNSASYSYPPPPPDALAYFAGQTNANVIACGDGISCAQPDMRAVSLFVVDFTAILNGDGLNNSVYFAPLAWNANGIPYGASTNGVTISYGARQALGGAINTDMASFQFQTGFWEASWANQPNRGNGNLQCYQGLSQSSSASTMYNLSADGINGLLVSKSGPNGSADTGYGSEVFQVTGLDTLSSSIALIKTRRGSVNTLGESDFAQIASSQILDPFHKYYSSLRTLWVNPASAITPYMHARTTGVSGFYATSSAAVDLGMLNFGSNKCLPYWARDTYSGLAGWGMDSAWLTANPTASGSGSIAVYPDSVLNPTSPKVFSFLPSSGAQRCTDVTPSGNTPFVICVNFLDSSISRFRTSYGGDVFSLL